MRKDKLTLNNKNTFKLFDLDFKRNMIFFQKFIKLLHDKMSEVKGRLSKDPVCKYVDRCVEVTWWMSVQDPSIYMDITDEKTFNNSLYKAYTKSGKVVDFYAWPALLLFKNGPVLMKGVAQCKK